MIVYKATNRINGRSYVGVTTRTLEERKYEHERLAEKGEGYVFHAALRKYGFDAFDWEVVDRAQNLDELYRKEREYIEKYNAFTEGYNLTLGGECPTEGLVGERHHFYGKERPEEVKKKIAMSMAKITEEDAKRIIKFIVDTDFSLSEISRMLGIPRYIVDNIAQGKSWKFLYEEPPGVTRRKRRKKEVKQRSDSISALVERVCKVLNIDRESVEYMIEGKAKKRVAPFLSAIVALGMEGDPS